MSLSKENVEGLCLKHQVEIGVAQPLNALAKAITKLAGDEVVDDPTEDQLVALVHRGVLSKEEALEALGRHLTGGPHV
jgi:hypothetical protein